jgi:hypothetical protein
MPNLTYRVVLSPTDLADDVLPVILRQAFATAGKNNCP